MANNQVMFGIANDLVNELVIQLGKNGNVDTGELKNSISAKIQGNNIIIEMAPQGEYIEYGTNPHIITPKNGKALKFNVDGKDVFTKKVNHPGIRPSPFIRPVIHQKLKKIIEKNIEQYG